MICVRSASAACQLPAIRASTGAGMLVRMTIVLGHTALGLWLSGRFDHVLHPQLPYQPRYLLGDEWAASALADMVHARCQPWRERSRTQPMRSQVDWTHVPTADEVQAARQTLALPDTAPLQVLAPTASERCRLVGVQCRVLSAAVPRGSFVFIKQDRYLPVPELAFLLAARELALPQLVACAMALCGSYAFDPDGSVTYGRYPVTTASRIGQYLAACKGVAGVDKARTVLRYVADGSASPMETESVIRLCLTPRCGGFHLAVPTLNSRLAVHRSHRGLAGKDFYVVDMLWPEQRVIVEYDGACGHSAERDRLKDATRRSVLGLMGYDFVTLTKGQMAPGRVFDETARAIAKRLGKRLSPDLDFYCEERWQLAHSVRSAVPDPFASR